MNEKGRESDLVSFNRGRWRGKWGIPQQLDVCLWNAPHFQIGRSTKTIYEYVWSGTKLEKKVRIANIVHFIHRHRHDYVAILAHFLKIWKLFLQMQSFHGHFVSSLHRHRYILPVLAQSNLLFHSCTRIFPNNQIFRGEIESLLDLEATAPTSILNLLHDSNALLQPLRRS